MKEILQKLNARTDLTESEAQRAFDAIMDGNVAPDLIAEFLLALSKKGLSVDEVTAAARAMRARSMKIDVGSMDVLDTCGTGGDVKGTFNISTAAAIVIASCGVKVVKHGNRAASSKSGSADVLEALGVKLDVKSDTLLACVESANICFAFARAHHPAMKHVAPVRAALGVPTVFNLLGPLTNPAGARRQLIGVYSERVGNLVAGALVRLGCHRAWVVHADDGLDELSTMSVTTVWEISDGSISTHRIDPPLLGIQSPSLESLRVSNADESARIIQAIFDGNDGPASDIVALNSGAGLVVAEVVGEIGDGLEIAREAIRSGRARATLRKLVEVTSVD